MNSSRYNVSKLFALAAALAVLSTHAEAHLHKSVTPRERAGLSLFAITLSPFAPAFATSTGSTAVAARKEQLAQQALDDAAVFYQTGELTGILPAVLQAFRAVDPENEKLSNIEIVDLVTAEAEKVLIQQ
jgi:hypothetical protein